MADAPLLQQRWLVRRTAVIALDKKSPSLGWGYSST